jgi:hypothetical protein
MPDVFIGPSEKLYKYFEPHFNEGIKRWRYHRSVEGIAQYKNNWGILSDSLSGKPTTPAQISTG